MVQFEPIRVPYMPIMDYVNLSTDQQNLYDFCSAIAKGHVSEALASRKLGPLCHSRWLTLAVRVLRLYISTPKPGAKLKVLVNYILFVYSPTWFDIKRDENFTNGPIHYYSLVDRSRKNLPAEQLEIVQKVLQHNNYY